MSKAFSAGLTDELPVEIKQSLLAIQIRCLKKYPGGYHMKHFIYTEDKAQVFLVSNLKIKKIIIELEEEDPRFEEKNNVSAD